MGFDVVQRYARRVAKCLQRTDLVHHVGLGFGGGNCHSAAAKALQIRQSRVCTHLHAVLLHSRTLFCITDGSPAWNPQAMFALVT